uniref:RING-type E3 ubiquitin transferase n=1 Tax=Lepisosteus oculatus TaxID=7918 RepID=W5N459_LEPOC
MKCSDCGHVAAEQNAKFCSECGKKLSQSQAPSQESCKTPPVLEDQLERGDEQRTDSEPSSVDSTTMQHNEQKRHSEDEDCPKKKRKKKKDKRKKSKQSSSLESEEMATELSDISLADKPTSAVEEEAVPSDSEDESGAMDDTAALVQEAGRSTQPVNTNTASQEPCPGSPAQVQKTRKIEGSNSSPTPHRAQTGSAQRSTEGSSSSHCSRNATREASASSPGAEPKPAEPARQQDLEQKPQAAGKLKQQQATAMDNKSVKNRKDTAQFQRGNLDQNPNVAGEPRETRNTSKIQEQEEKHMSGGDNKQLFSPLHQQKRNQDKPIEAKLASESEDKSQQESDTNGFQEVTGKKSKKRNKNKNNETNEQTQSSLNRVFEQQHIQPGDRLTIYFHAVLSKDFNFDPSKHKIYVRGGSVFGNWSCNAVELHVIKELEKHGFLVGGHLDVPKSSVVKKPIPYKYYLCCNGKDDYEHIYKWDVPEGTIVNRCLCIAEKDVSHHNEWHQFDDIICKKPSENFKRYFTVSYWTDQRKRDVRKGRFLAGNFMLYSIFDLLTEWNETNLNNFFSQLKMFYMTYQDPVIDENGPKKWFSLNFKENEVQSLLKDALIGLIGPHLEKETETRMVHIENPIKAAALVLILWEKYNIPLKPEERHVLCQLLCFPKLPKEQQISFCWDLKESFKSMKALRDILTNFCNVVMNEKQFRSILLIPLLHFLSDMCKPFEPIEWKRGITAEDVWGGLEGLPFVDFRNKIYQHEKDLLALMVSNKHLVDIDRMLTRSWLCFLKIENFLEYESVFNLDLLDLLQGLLYKLVQHEHRLQEPLFKILSHILDKLSDKESCVYEINYLMACLKAALKLQQCVCSSIKGLWNYELPIKSVEIIIKLSDLEEHLLPEENEGTKENLKELNINDLLSDSLQTMRQWIKKTFINRLLKSSTLSILSKYKNIFQMWNDVISLKSRKEMFLSNWISAHMKDFEGKLKQETPLSQIEIYCSKNDEMKQLNPLLAQCFENCALEAVHSICQENKAGVLFESLQRHKIGKFSSLVSKIIEKSWPISKQGKLLDGYDVMEHLLTWPASNNIFQLQGADANLIEELTDEAKSLITVSDSVFFDITTQLLSGNIQIKYLKIILRKREEFLTLLKIKEPSINDKNCNEHSMRSVLQWREAELDALLSERTWVDSLLKMCSKIHDFVNVDVEELEERHLYDIDLEKLCEVVVVLQLDQAAANDAGTVIYFQLDEEMRQMAKTIHTFKDSYIFQMCWENQAKTLSVTDLETEAFEPDPDLIITMDNINEEIFTPCFDKYQHIYSSMQTGTLTLGDVDEIFRDYKDRYDELGKDFLIMSKLNLSHDRKWIRIKIQQIKQYHQLHLAVESAKVIMEVKKTLNLNGDFHVLQTLLDVMHADFKGESLDCIDAELIKAKAILVDITEARRKCLQELGQRVVFVTWVKEALEDINELKVFVDLASISAGENDLDVDRVACFHDAVLGYSSMLYDLKPDSGFNEFKEVLKKLWKALENDHNLPKKLCDTARHLEWLKTVKDSHGSVELSSLSLASAINQKGIYIISSQYQKKVNLDTALQLRITEEHEDGQDVRCYSLEDLKELQNKLMLMSGKGEQGQCEVERFAEVFSSVQRLAMSFIDLHAAGNMLFRDWEAKINCSEHSEACIIMDFNLENTIGEIMFSGAVVEQLPDLCKKTEKYLRFWKEFMDRKRSQHYFLNYYTAEQIVYLCKKLTPDKQDSLEDQVLMLLSFITPNCTVSDIRECWHKWQYDDLKDISQPDEEMDFQTFVDETNMEVDIFLGSKEGTYTLEDLPALLHSAKGAEKLDLVWNFYMRDMKHFLPNCIDIGTLGKLLEILATKEDKEKKTVQRNLPNGLQQGCPNLIICPHDEILTSCICIYMSSMDEDLPTYDEVLLCSASTPYEQVEIFLRRCLTEGYKGKKIYTMLYADELSYDVSYRFEQLFQRLKMECRGDYRLVIICNSDREHFYIPSAFSQHKVHMIPHERLDKVQAYLSGHYTVSTEVPTAASVFKDRMFVGIVSSKRAGVGKSLYIRRLQEKLKQSTRDKSALLKCIRLIEPRVNENAILQSLLNTPKKKNQLTIFHFDITSSVQKGLYEFLFTLLVLHYLMDTEGHMWKCSNKHLYVIEILETSGGLPRKSSRNVSKAQYVFLDIFPKIFCRPPKEVLELEMRIQDDRMTDVSDPLMDDQEFRSEAYQRPYQYLTRFHNKMNLDSFTYRGVEGTHVECLQMFFVYCGILDPSWAELRNFAWFLNLQLKDSETSVFCDVNFTGDTLQGFKNFVVDFMIMMAKDFATPSLSISDQSPGRQQVDLAGVNEEDLAPFRIRKKWESEPHPYIFFNDDHISMTFIGFHLRLNDQNMVDAIDPSTQKIIKKNIMTKQLYDGLRLQRVPFNIDFDKLPRGEKIERLCNVLGIQWPLDPDETYELTTDNILKMLAIHMRFRCGIPVIIMGETGCGKTRLIKFLCELRRSGAPSQNMKLVKVHGGTSAEMIYTKVREAMSLALINKEEFLFDSVLFFDEANTTEAVSSIKEILCDNTVEGEPLCQNTGLQIIAACNPYRKHTDLMIQRLESAGLGYRVRAEETEDKLGSIPLRQLVYRVQALPPSMIPLVWDFGQLNDQTERMYIQQIVQRVIQTISVHANYIKMITEVLSCSQIYMRQMKDECSFVSLRDVERCMQVFVWFYRNHTMLLEELHAFETKDHNQHNDHNTRDPVVWSLIMAVGVCYHACLEKKEKYRKKICKHLPETNTHVKVMQEISLMQDLLLSGVPLGKTIAKNNALKENVFMMVICIELRIPLFLVGKPGSSKSLAKTLVADAMQGHAAHSELYKKLKQIHLVSFQCSPHSTPEGIINTFKQCARFQEGKNLTEYISVVVLDEIGLAEDSPKMPLKTLHPLLEEGCIDDEPLPHKKVGFIGISNWALDPAKMNRGIFVSRGDPDEKELIESAKGICSSEPMILKKVQGFFQVFARAYLNICKEQGKEFFGLRDYYSLIKMVFAMTKASDQEPSAKQIVEAVLRNFSGRDDVDTVAAFTSKLKENPEISTMELVRQNIEAVGQDDECRYLLVLTKNYAALQILQQTFFSDQHQPEIIFGSSFPKDQEYTQICRNINRVKICMETGRTIVLLNLQNLYESLYDALNQYYVCLGGQKYVDLGLGTHRVKCRVHRDFRLIVIEEKEVVYKQFPIPLINRLEKHYLDINTVLKSDQKQIVKELEKWVKDFTALNLQHSLNPQAHNYVPSDVFIGYHSDTCASVVLQVTEKLKGNLGASEEQRKVLQETKLVLLNCATPDSVVRLSSTCLSNVETEELANAYFETQKHDSLASFILSHVLQEERSQTSFTEVTTFSRLLTASDVDRLLQDVISFQNVELLSLQQFDTEHSFLKKIRSFLDTRFGNKILIIQTDFVEDSQSSNLIASAKYSAINEINKSRDEMTEILVYFITKLPRMEGGTSYVGFHGVLARIGPWRSVHIDDLRKSKDIVSDITTLKSLTISQLFEEREKPNKPEAMETDDTKMESPTLEENADLEDILDTTALVRSCVQSAVGMLRDQLEGGSRSTRRLEILLTLLAENEETKASFLKTMKRRLHALLVTHDENTPSPKNWVFKEASNIDALQEGGTFRHTLWKRVQAVVIPFLAQVISMIDRDCNLDLLVDSNSVESVKKLWLEIFGNLKLLYIPYTKVDRNSESKTILVQNYMKLDHNLCSTMPFSWRIKDHLDELWVHVLQREVSQGHTHNQLEEFFKKTPLGRYIADADEEMQKEFFHRYLQDFISMTMKVTSPDELMLLRSALLSCVNELKIRSNANKEKVTSLPWVHTAYHEFKTRLQNLSRMITIEPQVAQFLQRKMQSREGAEMVLDVYAAVACVELLEPHNLDTDGLCLEWLRRVKRLQVPIELVCAEECVQNYGSRSQELVKFVRSGWNRIFSSSLFVEHVLLGIESVQKDLKVLVVTHARKLWKSLEQNSDFKMEQPFLAVIEVLKSCKDEASERLFRFGRQLCAVCLGEPTDPLCLPCEHIYCLVCIKQWLLPGQMYCPLCMVEVPQNFELKVSEDIRHLVQLYAQFRKRCNAFFIDMVSTLCFKDNSPPSDSIILHLLSFLMVDTNAVPNIKKGRRVYTKALSPFNDSVDKNPVVRSVVLKFLLKYSFDDVKRYLQEHLSSVEQSNILEKTDKTKLCALYINCLEDSMYEKTQSQTELETVASLEQETRFLQCCVQNTEAGPEKISIEYLQSIARIRLCLDTAACLLVKDLSGLGEATGTQQDPEVYRRISAFLNHVMEFCRRSKNDWYRIYMIRKICNQKGMEFVQTLLTKPEFHWLFPEEIVQQNEHTGQIDQYLVCGINYQAFRDAVGRAMIECKTEGIEEANKNCRSPLQKKTARLLLAIFREVTTLYRAANQNVHPKPEQCQAIEDFIKGSQIFGSPELKNLATSLVYNRLGDLSVRPDCTSSEHAITELAIHLTTVLLCGQDGILTPLKQLALAPVNMQNAFLPTMPEDMLVVAVQVLGNLQWYSCPNGHPCTIGECGQPMERSHCVDCGAVIGGDNHRAVQGFQQTNFTGDRTQTGHVLGDARRRDNPDMLDTKSMSPAPFILIRLLTHLAMLLGASRDPRSISQMIKPAVQNPHVFLVNHLVKDMEQLSRTLGKGTDDSVNIVHLLLSRLLEPHQAQQWPVPYDNILSTKEARNGWETVIATEIITPQLKSLERRLKEVNDLIRKDSRVSSSPIMKVIYGDPHIFLKALPLDKIFHCSAIWSCRERVSVQNLAHIVEQHDGKDTLPVLWKFLQKEAELKLVKFLPDILALQRNLVRKFQNVTEHMHKTIGDFIQSQKAESLKAWYETRICTFLTVWNQLRASLVTNGEIKISEDYCKEDLNLDSEFQVLLPQRHGLGLCSTALVSYLIALHNELVYTVEKHTGEENSYSVSPADLTDLHVIKYEVEKDLIPLILSNCQYSMEQGQETVLEYDLHKTQQQILNHFLQGKPLITLTGIPTLVNRQDRNYENIFKDVKGKLMQDSLPALMLNALSGELQSYTDVCEALSVVEVTLGFLAMTGGEAEMQLVKYVQDILQMGDQTAPHILKALSRCTLKHSIALWQLLTSLKSECMLRLKRDPFLEISKVYKKPLLDGDKKLLTGFLTKGCVDTFVLEMHEFLLLNLKKVNAPEEFRPDWSLKHTLVSYIERKDLDVPPDMEEILPEETCLSQFVETWKFAVAFRQERHQR